MHILNKNENGTANECKFMKRKKKNTHKNAVNRHCVVKHLKFEKYLSLRRFEESSTSKNNTNIESSRSKVVVSNDSYDILHFVHGFLSYLVCLLFLLQRG